jgi:hypothetical protein
MEFRRVLFRSAAGRSRSAALKFATAAIVGLACVYTMVGIFGTIAFMWGPNL